MIFKEQILRGRSGFSEAADSPCLRIIFPRYCCSHLSHKNRNKSQTITGITTTPPLPQPFYWWKIIHLNPSVMAWACRSDTETIVPDNFLFIQELETIEFLEWMNLNEFFYFYGQTLTHLWSRLGTVTIWWRSCCWWTCERCSGSSRRRPSQEPRNVWERGICSNESEKGC